MGETVLHSFSPHPRGAFPEASVCLGPGGMYYGTTYGGGPRNAGVVWWVDNAGHQAILHGFAGGADGNAPYSRVLCNSAGLSKAENGVACGNLEGSTFATAAF